jgi:hypothetical protein
MTLDISNQESLLIRCIQGPASPQEPGLFATLPDLAPNLMTDPITTVVTVISEHPQAAAAVASIYGVAKPFLAKILGPSAKEIGEIGRDYIKGRRGKNAERTLADANKLLDAVGREPQEVPLATLVPLLEGASTQEEPTLAEKWAALLANAADPVQRVAVQPGFTDVLRQLSADDASLLTKIYAEYEWSDEQPPRLFDVDYLSSQLKWDATRLNLSLDNLLRLRLVDALVAAVFGPAPTLRGNTALGITVYGEQFLKAVTPPTP